MASNNEIVKKLFAWARSESQRLFHYNCNCECMNENERLKIELAAKDEKIDKLEEIRREYINMQSNVTALRREVSLKQDQHIAQCREYREKIAELRRCLKVAEEAIDKAYRCADRDNHLLIRRICDEALTAIRKEGESK